MKHVRFRFDGVGKHHTISELPMRKRSRVLGSLLRLGEFVTKSFGVGERRTSRVLDGFVEIGATAIR